MRVIGSKNQFVHALNYFKRFGVTAFNDNDRTVRPTLSEDEKSDLRRKLAGYPGMTEETIDDAVYAYEERMELKQHLRRDLRQSNAMAESILDRKGYPRPPGWHSVFFYPGSNRPRNKYLLYLVVLIIFIQLDT